MVGHFLSPLVSLSKLVDHVLLNRKHNICQIEWCPLFQSIVVLRGSTEKSTQNKSCLEWVDRGMDRPFCTICKTPLVHRLYKHVLVVLDNDLQEA